MKGWAMLSQILGGGEASPREGEAPTLVRCSGGSSAAWRSGAGCGGGFGEDSLQV